MQFKNFKATASIMDTWRFGFLLYVRLKSLKDSSSIEFLTDTDKMLHFQQWLAAPTLRARSVDGSKTTKIAQFSGATAELKRGKSFAMVEDGWGNSETARLVSTHYMWLVLLFYGLNWCWAVYAQPIIVPSPYICSVQDFKWNIRLRLIDGWLMGDILVKCFMLFRHSTAKPQSPVVWKHASTSGNFDQSHLIHIHFMSHVSQHSSLLCKLYSAFSSAGTWTYRIYTCINWNTLDFEIMMQE